VSVTRHRRELWLYRIGLLTLLLAWVWQRFGIELRFWWRNGEHWEFWLAPGLALAIASLVRRPRSSRGFAAGLGLLLLGYVGHLLTAPYDAHHVHTTDQECRQILKSLAMEALVYAMDHDGRLPSGLPDEWLASHSSRKWATLRGCPARRGQPRPYVMNPYLGGRSVEALPDELRRRTVMLYESVDGVTVAYPHDGMTCVAFANGLVEWFPRDRLDVIWNPWEPPAADPTAPRLPGSEWPR